MQTQLNQHTRLVVLMTNSPVGHGSFHPCFEGGSVFLREHYEKKEKKSPIKANH